MPMISRRPMWMLLVTCALLSSGSSTMTLAAAQEVGQDGRWSQGIDVRPGELLLSQEAEATPAESGSDEESPDGESTGSLDRPTLSLGSSGPLVIQIQVLLQEQGLYRGTISGDFDADTVTAVKAFQTENDLEPTGSLDSATWGPLTGEIAEPEAAPPEEASPSAQPPASDAGPSTLMRLLIAAAALIGLGAGGFGLWKILSVPVPQPLAYPDPEDDEDDYLNELEGEQDYASQSVPSRPSKLSDGQNVSPITVPAALAAQSSPAPSGADLGERLGSVEGEQLDFVDLEGMDLAESSGRIAETVELAGVDESSVSLAAASQRVAMAASGDMDLAQVEKTAQLDGRQHVANPQQPSGPQAGVKETQQNLAPSPRKPESPTDTAVAIATQSARAAAARQQSSSADPAQSTVRPAAPVASRPSPSRSAQAAGQRKSSLAKARGAQTGRNPAGRGVQTPPPPPPAPSEIVRSAPAGSLEQPELITTPLRGRVDIVETLITDLQGANPAKRRKAIWELGQRCDSRAIQPLVNMMANSDSRQRSLILAALSEIGTQTLKPMKEALAMSLQDDNAEVRKNAIRDLTRIYDLVAQISHLLNAALDDPDPEVQDTARWALKQLNRIRSNAGLEGGADQPILQQSVSPPESFSAEGTFKPRSLPKA